MSGGHAGLDAIVYVSSATRRLSEQDLQQLLECSRARNLREDITGLLLFCDGSFMQYIEGPREPLAQVYASICRDTRHHSLIELVNEPVGAREFAGWSMACASAQLEDFDSLLNSSWRDAAGAGAGGRPLREVWSRLRQANRW
jgi:hypothetical protein